MKSIRKAVIAAALTGSTLVGGALGSALFNGSANAQTTTTPTTAPASGRGSTNVAPSGTFHSNEDPAHEANESPQREAQEDAGQFPTVP